MDKKDLSIYAEDIRYLREVFNYLKGPQTKEVIPIPSNDGVRYALMVETEESEAFYNAKLAEVEKFAYELRQKFVQSEYEKREQARQCELLKAQLGAKEASHDYAMEIEELREEVNRLRLENQQLATENDNSALNRVNTSHVRQMSSELEKYKTIANSRDVQIADLIDANNALLKENSRTKEELQNVLHEKEYFKEQNRAIRNKLILIEGSIKVICRIKPRNEHSHQNFLCTNTSIKLLNDHKSLFTFDKVLLPEDGQCSVYKEISPLVQCFLDGYNTTIFAYGQTGSGKTYTMIGEHGAEGVVFSVIRDLFKHLRAIDQRGLVRLSVFEIYNEKLRDLISDTQSKMKIEHLNDTTHLEGAAYVTVDNEDVMFSIINKGLAGRSSASTNCNDRSSRSHCIIKIELSQTSENVQKYSVLNLIDLAGSERLSESGAQGTVLKETQFINKSLSTLGNVINAVIRGDAHVPYRDSKLTYYLKNYLAGNSLCLMFVNMSADMSHYNETLCSLRFAQKVSECKSKSVKQNATCKL